MTVYKSSCPICKLSIPRHLIGSTLNKGNRSALKSRKISAWPPRRLIILTVAIVRIHECSECLQDGYRHPCGEAGVRLVCHRRAALRRSILQEIQVVQTVPPDGGKQKGSGHLFIALIPLTLPGIAAPLPQHEHRLGHHI